jgi:nitric oxide reductase subunit C
MFSPVAARVSVLTAFVVAVATAGSPPSPAVNDHGQLSGEALARELGCGGCHTGVPGTDLVRQRVPAVGPEATPLPTDFVFDYLAAPTRRRQDIGQTRMPDFGLDEGERIALALFLGTGAPSGPAAEAAGRHPRADATLGARMFGVLGCAGCHGNGGDTEPSPVGPDLSREGVRVRPQWLRAFLRAPFPVRRDGNPGSPGARMPDFRLTDEEIASLSSYLGGLGTRLVTLDTTRLSPFQSRRTGRFMEERLACLGCHELGGVGGGIGPSLDGLTGRLDESFVLEMILDPGRAAPGSAMPRQEMPEREARRVARYLLDHETEGRTTDHASLVDASHPAWASQVPTGASEGSALYARHCTACHGTGGQGDGWNAPRLPVPPTAHADSSRSARRADDTLFDGIHSGAWVLDGSPRMPPFGSLLSPDQIRSLVAHIRVLCACEGPSWSRDGGRIRP